MLALLMLGGLIVIGFPSCSAPVDPHAFPSDYYAENPIVGSELTRPSLYISDVQGLERHRDEVDEPYAQFLEHADERLAELAKTSRNAEFAAWCESKRASPLLLEVHDVAYIGGINPLFSDQYLQFPDTADYQAWQQSFPDYGVAIELVPDPLRADLPEALKEVYRLGVLWLYCVPQSGYFYHPKAIQLAVNEEWLGEYISDSLYIPLGYPMDELMVFYTDSGCWLMYDKEERVYCGGVECGDFYRSSQNLDQVIGNIFRALLTKSPWHSIEAFAPR